jgi:hypothetical protein
VLLDWQLGFIVEDFVEHVGRVANGAGNDLRAVRRVLIRGPGVMSNPAAEPKERVNAVE